MTALRGTGFSFVIALAFVALFAPVTAFAAPCDFTQGILSIGTNGGCTVSEGPNSNNYPTPTRPGQNNHPLVAPESWTCRVSGSGNQGEVYRYMCTPPSNNSWIFGECRDTDELQRNISAGLTRSAVYYACFVCSGSGQSGTCIPSTRYSTQGGWLNPFDINTVRTNTPVLDPETGATVSDAEGDLERDEPEVVDRSNLFSAIFGGVPNFLTGILIEGVAFIIWFFSEILVWILNGILAIVAFFFDYVVKEFVIEMGKYVTADSSGAVREAWIIIRDLANIGIIAGLVATAIGTIVGVGNYSISKTLARLILAALLVNFSYFFAGAIIDFSNFTAKAAYETVIYKAGCNADGSCGIAGRVGKLTDLPGLSSRVQEAAVADAAPEARLGEREGVSEVNGEVRSASKAFVPSRQATFNVMLIVFILVTMFVFLSAISLLIARFIALIFLLITSPIGIAGGAVPLLKSYADEWWKAMWSQAMFAPVYFLLAGISLNMLDQFAGQLNTGAYDPNSPFGAIGALEGMIPIIAVFTVAIGFMWAALSTAKKMAAESARFKELYDGVQKYLTKPIAGTATYMGSLGAREVFGRGALWLAERQRGAAVRVKDWAENSRIGKVVSKIPGIKMAARAADRALQSQLDKTANQKWGGKDGKGGVKGFKDLRDEKLKRKAEIQRKKEQLENEDKRDGRQAEKDLKDEGRKLKASKKGIEAEIKDLEKIPEGSRNEEQRNRLATLRDKLAGVKEKMDRIAKFKERIKASRIGKQPLREAGVEIDERTGEKLESGVLNRLYDERRQMQKNGTWSGPEMAALEKKIQEEEAFEKQKDEYGWGGTDGIERRARAQYERAIGEGGGLLRGFNEKKHAEFLEGKEVMSADEEKTYADALNTPPNQRTDAQKALIDNFNSNPNRKITSKEAAVRQNYRERSTPITQEENTQLQADIARRDRGEITDPKKLALIAALESRKNAGGVIDAAGNVTGANGLSENAQESHLAFAARQGLRVDGFDKRNIEIDQDKTDALGVTTYKLDDLYGYKRNLEVGSAINLRGKRGDRTSLVDNLGLDFIKEEYKKNPQRIIQYATALNDEDWDKLSKDHEIDEGILNQMSIARTRRWGDEFTSLQQDILDGKVIEGSEEYNQRSNDLFNQQVNYIPRKEFLSALRSNAVIGHLHNPKTGEEMHVRFKDLNTDTGEDFGNLRKLTWSSTSSTMFADAKDANMFGRNMTAEIAKAKRSGAEKIIVTDHAVSDMFELEGDDLFLTKRGGKVQADAAGRARKATAVSISEIDKKLKTLESGDPVANAPEIVRLHREKRFAQLHQDKLAGRGPFQEVIQNAVSNADTRNTAREELRVKLGLEPGQEKNIPETDIDSYIKIKVKQERREAVFAMSEDDLANDQTARDQKLVFEVEDQNDAAGAARMRGWTPKEAQAVINDRSLLSTAIQKHATEEQIPVLLDGPDPAEKETFIQGLLLSRSSGQINSFLRNPAIQAVWIAPTKATLREINIRRLAKGEDALDIPTID